MRKIKPVGILMRFLQNRKTMELERSEPVSKLKTARVIHSIFLRNLRARVPIYRILNFNLLAMDIVFH